MSNARFLIRNLVDTAGISASPALLTTLPETNLQKLPRSLSARTTSLASQDIKLSWASDQTANMFWESFTNFTAAAQRRIILYPNADWTGTPTYDPGAVNCWAYTGLSAHFSALDAESRIRKNGAVYFTQTTFKSAIIRYTDAANTDAYMDVSRMGLGNYFEFTYQFPFAPGAQKPSSLSSSIDLGDGSTSTNKGENFIELPLSHDFITETDWPHVMAMADYLGTDRDCWFSLYPGLGTYKEMYYQGRFKFREPSAFETHFYQMQKGGFMLRGQ